jgi:hypothetical protein
MSDPVNFSWVCTACKGGRRSVVGACASPVASTSSTSKQQLVKKPASTKGDATGLALEVSKDFITSKFDEMKNMLEDIKDDNKQLRDRVIRLENKFAELESIVHDLEANADITRRKSLENNIIVKGIPATPNENIDEIIHCISLKVGFVLSESSIVKSVRLNRSSSTKFDALLVTFAEHSTKTQFVENFRRKKDIGLSDVLQQYKDHPLFQNTKIFVRDDLTKLQRELFKLAKDAQEDLNLKFVWMKNGDIFARKFESSRVF